MNPRWHLRLLYEGYPMAFLTEQAGGKAVDGKGRLLDKPCEGLHMRTPLFVGSARDIEDLVAMGDVQQSNTPKGGYAV